MKRPESALGRLGWLGSCFLVGCGSSSSEEPAETGVDPPTMVSGTVVPGGSQVQQPNVEPGAGGSAPTTPEGTTEAGHATQLDLLFVVDNSYGMADKQAVLALAMPELVARLVSPACVDDDWAIVSRPLLASDACEAGAREFQPLEDVHLALITTSLGGYGAQAECSGDGYVGAEQTIDAAHLLGRLPRGEAVAPSAVEAGFLAWVSTTDPASVGSEFGALVNAAGESGCGWEAPLEAWLRFLVDPFPYTKIVRQPCNADDTQFSCSGPEIDPANSSPLVDTVILDQRKQFLRPSSVLSIVMFSDENDCSFKANGQSWRLAQSSILDDSGNRAYYPAFRGTAACNDPAYGPNHECCLSCTEMVVPGNCPTAMNADGAAVALGCEVSRRFTIDELGDAPNLRCYDQKRRFGLDLLYPLERYINALTQPRICTVSETLDPQACAALSAEPVRNPLFDDLSPNVDPVNPSMRSGSSVFLMGIVGIPWQDLAIDAAADELRYRVTRADAEPSQRLDWNTFLGDVPPSGGGVPTDPLLRESIPPRSGSNPVTSEPLAPPSSALLMNKVNGHEWTILDLAALQYACIFPIAERPCLTREEASEQRDQGIAVPSCVCTDYKDETWSNPLCQNADGSYGMTQRYAAAYPALRQLEVLQRLGDRAIVASICPRSLDMMRADAGYRPALDALFGRLREALE